MKKLLMKKVLWIAALAIVQAFSWPSGTASAQDIPLTTLGAGSAHAVNTFGQIAGRSGDKAVLWNSDGTVINPDLGWLGGRAIAEGLNDQGLVVGESALSYSVYPTHACAWVGGHIVDLGAAWADADSAAIAVNNAGQIVGYGPLGATMWTIDANGGISTKALGGSLAADINDQGEVVGWGYTSSGQRHALLWSPNGTMQDLGTLPGGRMSVANGINSLGHVTGYGDVQVYDSLGQSHVVNHAFLWTPEGGMVDLGDPLSWSDSYGVGLNDADEVAGTYYRFVDYGTSKGFLPVGPFFWSADRGWVDLPVSTTNGARAYDINNDGTVIGEDYLWAAAWHVRPQVTQPPPPPPPPPPDQFVGFAAPLLNDGTAEFELGKRIPVEFQLVDWTGSFVATATPTLHVYRTVGDVVETTDLAPAGASFRYERHANRYSYDLSSRALGTGTFVLRVVLEDGSHEVRFAVRGRARR